MSIQAINSPARGILCMVAGTLLLISQDGISKWLLGEIHTGEIMGWRALFSLPFVLLLLRVEGYRVETLRSRAPGQNALRAMFAFLTSVLVILAYKVMPMADALAVVFTAPLITTALSGLILGEPVGWRRWAATCAGFAGAILIVGPSFDAIGVWALAPLGAAISTSLRDITTRKLGTVDTGPSILFWSLVVAAIGGYASFPVMGASMPRPTVWVLLVIAAVMVTLSYRLIIAAFKFASGAVVAPLSYLSVVWGAGIGYVVWGDVPNTRKVVGAAIVVAAGLYVWRRELRPATER